MGSVESMDHKSLVPQLLWFFFSAFSDKNTRPYIYPIRKRGEYFGIRNSEVVQRQQGFWIH